MSSQEEVNKNLNEVFNISDKQSDLTLANLNTEQLSVELTLDQLYNEEEVEVDNPLYLSPSDVTQVLDYMDFDISNE